jgi:hypothetical protein
MSKIAEITVTEDLAAVAESKRLQVERMVTVTFLKDKRRRMRVYHAGKEIMIRKFEIVEGKGAMGGNDLVLTIPSGGFEIDVVEEFEPRNK